MADWFTVEKIDSATFAISEYRHFEEVHSYLLIGTRAVPDWHGYSGDLIYQGCLDAFYPTTDPILFMRSVETMRSLDIKRILPAHHRLDSSVSLIEKISQAFRKFINKTG